MDKKANIELTTFVGLYATSLVKAGYEASEAKRMVSQDLINEALILCDDNNGSYDYYALQSMFLSVAYILKREVSRMSSDISIPQVKKEIDKINSVVNYLENRVKNINKGTSK